MSEPICRDCGQSHPELNMMTEGVYYTRDVRFCLLALIKRVEKLERGAPRSSETTPGEAKESDRE